MIKTIFSVIVLLLCFIECIDEVKQLVSMSITKLSGNLVDGGVILPLAAFTVCVIMLFMDYAFFVKITLCVYASYCFKELYYFWRLKER